MSLTKPLTEYQSAKRDRQFNQDFQYDADLGWVERERGNVVRMAARRIAPTTPRRTGHRQRQEGSRSSAASGDGNDSDPDPDPERRAQQSLRLYDQASLADLLNISKKTLQNLYSTAPHTLPQAIAIPGARGPRWTPQAIQEWLEQRPRHTPKTAPVAPTRKVGRPRIALRSAGGAS